MSSKGSLIGFWIAALALGMKLDLWHEKQFLPPAENRKADDVLVDVVGEIRTVLARYLWFRMDLFHEVLDDQGVQAEQQTEVLPLLRMVTLLDPSMTDSYDQIVWDLYRGQHKVELARTLLNEGLERNPKSYELNFRKALIAFMEEEFLESQQAAIATLPLTRDIIRLTDCHRLIYWSAVKLKDVDTQKRALTALLTIRPNDVLYVNELKKLESSQTQK